MDNLTEKEDDRNEDIRSGEPREESSETLEGSEDASAETQFQHETTDFDLKLATEKALEEQASLYEPKIEELRRFVKKMEEDRREIEGRLSREMDQKIFAKVASVLSPFLQLIAQLDRVASVDSENLEDLQAGIRLLQKKLVADLQSAGLSERGKPGDEFDPTIHEAVQVKTIEQDELDGKLVDVFQPAYFLGEKLLLAGKVVVGKRVES
ncbi:MAG: nucleotide exchange factor GrpE [Bradymonadales bacterium]|nr:MAG: nucleotide exchange factor GrpE [Bradymonadales bacterium]